LPDGALKDDAWAQIGSFLHFRTEHAVCTKASIPIGNRQRGASEIGLQIDAKWNMGSLRAELNETPMARPVREFTGTTPGVPLPRAIRVRASFSSTR
jgi:hypothetical protein